jgi:hypothetical protein
MIVLDIDNSSGSLRAIDAEMERLGTNLGLERWGVAADESVVADEFAQPRHSLAEVQI